MYVGRIVAIGKNRDDRLVAMYRVSARAFPNRRSKEIGSTIAIIPKEGFEVDLRKNPYISYNCLRITKDYAVVGNGSHTDPIAERLDSGMNRRDALITVLFGLDYEHDDYRTPRIAAIADRGNMAGTLGIGRHNALLIKDVDIKECEAFYIATYEHNYPSDKFCDREFQATTVEEACDYILRKGVFADLERPILAACAIETDTSFSIGYKDLETCELTIPIP
ncbi:IMP cyclohydrolase [Thermodesulfobacteriota bacterium]